MPQAPQKEVSGDGEKDGRHGATLPNASGGQKGRGTAYLLFVANVEGLDNIKPLLAESEVFERAVMDNGRTTARLQPGKPLLAPYADNGIIISSNPSIKLQALREAQRGCGRLCAAP